jgi:hypothetical protein
MKYSILFLGLLASFFSCDEESEFEYPLVLTGEVINLTDTSATFTGKITHQGTKPIIESGFIWGLHINLDDGIKIQNEGIPDGVFELQTNYKLLPGKTYYIQAYAQTESSVTYGRTITFQSPEGPINLGQWSVLSRHENLIGLYINTSFTMGNLTYLIFESGNLYSLNRENLAFEYEFSNPAFNNADLSFVYNDQAYIYSLDTIYRVDLQDKTLEKLSFVDHHGKFRFGVAGFLLGDNIYVGLGQYFEEYYKELWKYNIPGNTWQQVSSFPGDARSNAYSFSLDNKGYFGGGNNNQRAWKELWCYEPERDQWRRLEDLPIALEYEAYNLPGTSMAGFGYCYFDYKLFEFNPVFNNWEMMAGMSVNPDLGIPHLFSADDHLYAINATMDWMDEIYLNLCVYEK